MGEDLIENKIYVAELVGSDLQDNALYRLEPLKRIGNATFVKVNPELKKGDLAIFWDNNYPNPLIRLYHAKSHRGNKHYDNIGSDWDYAVKWDGTKEQFEKVLRGEIN